MKLRVMTPTDVIMDLDAQHVTAEDVNMAMREGASRFPDTVTVRWTTPTSRSSSLTPGSSQRM